MPDTQAFAPARRGQNASLYTEEAVSSMTAVLSRFPDPDDMLVKAGLTRASLRPLEYDDEIAQCIDTRREALIAVPWRLEPQQGRASKRLTTILDPHIENLVRGAFEAVLYGYSVQEVVYRPESGGIGIDRISVKPLEWFYIGTDGKLMHRQQTGGVDIECDLRKFLLTRRQPSYRQPYGESLLTRLYWTAFFRGHGRKFWAKFLERFGEPLLVGKVKDQQKFVADVAALGLAAGLPVQPEDEIEHIAVTQAGEFERFENALSRSIQKIILTICYGSTTSVKPGQYATLTECKQRLDADMLNAVEQVERCAPGLPENVLAAFADAAYNVGPKIACDTQNSTAARLLKSGDLAGACRQLPKWDKARIAGVMFALPGLTRRRQAEMELCLS